MDGAKHGHVRSVSLKCRPVRQNDSGFTLLAEQVSVESAIGGSRHGRRESVSLPVACHIGHSVEAACSAAANAVMKLPCHPNDTTTPCTEVALWGREATVLPASLPHKAHAASPNCAVSPRPAGQGDNKSLDFLRLLPLAPVWLRLVAQVPCW